MTRPITPTVFRLESKVSRKVAEEQGIDLDEATRLIEGLDRYTRPAASCAASTLSNALRADKKDQHRVGCSLDCFGLRF